MDREAVLELMRKTGALLEGHFQLSSGLHSDRYFQCALVLQHPEHAAALARAFSSRLETEIDVVVGPAMGAVVWQHEVARALGTRGVFTERVDGEMSLRRGFELAQGERVLVVEDVLTTGGSAAEVLRLLRSLGAEPVAVGSLINRSGGNPFQDQDLPLTSLAEVEAVVWKPEDCPLCAAGGSPVKPGSRSAVSLGGKTGHVAGGSPS